MELTHLFAAEAFAEVSVRQSARSRCRVTTVQLTGANASYRIDLDGAEAENSLGGAFLAADGEHCVVTLHTAHNVPDCRSDSAVKGVAGGRAVGEFRGLVYVAPGAQRTDARQQSRNILLSREARITTQPQLEIYADDVKCSHGATVGQMDAEAILYMRQRGLSEADARRLQIEGLRGRRRAPVRRRAALRGRDGDGFRQNGTVVDMFDVEKKYAGSFRFSPAGSMGSRSFTSTAGRRRRSPAA